MMSMKATNSSVTAIVASSLAALIIAGVVFWRQKKKQTVNKVPIPTKWRKVGEVGELLLYPLKGAKRRCVLEAECTERGLRLPEEPNKLTLQDRIFLVFNEENKFINGKIHPNIFLVDIEVLDERRVKFSFPDSEDLVVQIPGNNNDMSQVNFYGGEKVQTVDCGEEAAQWFSERLLNEPKGLRLGFFLPSLVPLRTVGAAHTKQREVYKKLCSDYMGAYADIASYMLMSEESVKDLNSRLEKPVTEHHFRPNILVKGSAAYSEDDWDWIKIGDNVVLRSFKYCTRCVITSINPDTAEKNPTTEPLRTLRTYRQVREPDIKKVEGSSPVMGQYAGCHIPGLVRVGDAVYVNDD